MGVGATDAATDGGGDCSSNASGCCSGRDCFLGVQVEDSLERLEKYLGEAGRGPGSVERRARVTAAWLLRGACCKHL